MNSAKSNFIDLELSFQNMDIYYQRTAIFRALQTYLPQFAGKMLDVGCGQMPYKQHILQHSEVQEYVGLDIEAAIEYDKDVRPDLRWDGITMPLPDNSFHTVMATEVLEHCPDPRILMREVLRVLSPGGLFFFTVPFLWNLHERPHDYYRYTPFALKMLLEESGFESVELNIMGGWQAAMAQMMGLWIRRSNAKHSRLIRLASPIFFQFYKMLLKKSTVEFGPFEHQTMLTGLFGIAKKK